MNNYERRLFDGKCPYTDEPCVNDIDCYECETNREEWHLFEDEQGEKNDA